MPPHLSKYKTFRGVKRVREKIKARHLRAAYQIFAKRRDKNALFQKYASKDLALRLTQRGKTWKRKNISMIGENILNKEDVIKAEFESRV